MNQELETKIRCGCKFCSEGRAVEQHKIKIGFDSFPEEAKKLINELEEKVFYLEDDLNYKDAIINGSWPSADDIIKSQRERINREPTEEEIEESEKYHRWEMKIIVNGEEKWVPANRSDDGEYTPKN